MRRLLLCLACLAAACYDGPYGEPAGAPEPPPVTTSLAELRRLYRGEPVTLRTPIVVAGRVTTSDRSGNFYRTLLVESQGGALELLAGLDALCNDYPVGALLTLRLEGLTLDERFGVLQAGRAATAAATYSLDYLGSQAALDRCLFRHAEPLEAVEPLRLRIDELTPACCGRLVRIDGLRYAPEEAVAESCWSGYRRFADAEGGAVFTYVRAYADFADEELPYGRCSLVGILQRDASGRYLLKLRDAKDCLP
ncbi:DUF5689 domain-containing protein [uncultured Alistipes sp.]|uniref:DUF5689 domain-containing protein n=1 Tax=uncultured Alistipes sp. TaxID=538949 RepID=UPI00262C006F|nr:DUF5689 domain-containing protein [uncultured Alistipes sp.]